MKTSFLIMALRYLGASIKKAAVDATVDAKFITVDLALTLSVLTSRYNWLQLCEEHQAVLNFKFSDPQEKLFAELKNSMKEYPELENYDFVDGDPFLFVAKSRAKSLTEMRQQHGDNTPCINVSLLAPVTSTVMLYNLTYKHQELLPEQFKTVEAEMKALSKQYRWAARGSWNSRVEKEEKQKRSSDFSFRRVFGKKQLTD
ncbi:MAG: hypothetical protein QM734_02945 [Cyclobacteriaceae bacterium]